MGEWRHCSTVLTSVENWSEWSAIRPGRFIIVERTPGTQWVQDVVDPIAGLDPIERRKICEPCRELNPSSGSQSVAKRLSCFDRSNYWCEANYTAVSMHSLHLNKMSSVGPV
jgi:hypothetical protein